MKYWSRAFAETNFRRRDAEIEANPDQVILWDMIDESLLARVVNLSPADRLEFIGAVWDTLSPDNLPVTEAEKALLDTRLADMEQNPS